MKSKFKPRDKVILKVDDYFSARKGWIGTVIGPSSMKGKVRVTWDGRDRVSPVMEKDLTLVSYRKDFTARYAKNKPEGL